MPDAIEWSADGIDYIGSRSTRYPGAVDIEPGWTQEVLTDPDLIAFEPDPKSRMGASRFIGESPTAGTVLVVIGYRDLDGLARHQRLAGYRNRSRLVRGRSE